MTPSAVRDVYVILMRGSELLLLLRENTGYRDGEWGLPAGKVERDETYVDAASRELREETGIALPGPNALRLVHLLERRTAGGELWLGAFFRCESAGDPVNLEAHKHGAMGWFPASALPECTSDYIAHVMAGIERGVAYSVWRA